MKRDMDLVREILITIEKYEHGRAPQNLAIDGYTDEQIGYHVHLMGQAGLLKVADATTRGCASPRAVPRSMTWEGHEFLEVAREPSRWRRAVEKVKTAGAAMSIDILKEVLAGLAKQALGPH